MAAPSRGNHKLPLSARVWYFYLDSVRPRMVDEDVVFQTEQEFRGWFNKAFSAKAKWPKVLRSWKRGEVVRELGMFWRGTDSMEAREYISIRESALCVEGEARGMLGVFAAKTIAADKKLRCRHCRSTRRQLEKGFRFTQCHCPLGWTHVVREGTLRHSYFGGYLIGKRDERRKRGFQQDEGNICLMTGAASLINHQCNDTNAVIEEETIPWGARQRVVFSIRTSDKVKAGEELVWDYYDGSGVPEWCTNPNCWHMRRQRQRRCSSDDDDDDDDFEENRRSTRASSSAKKRRRRS